MRLMPFVMRAFALVFAVVALAACQETPKALVPVPKALMNKMEQLGMDAAAPIYIRIFKQDSELEVWKQKRDGQYALLKTYSICKWSGDLGPKLVEGDRQAPEGFYTVTPAQMNPNSNYYLSFNIGYPNAYDKSLGHTGSNLMVHGACSSAGCYSMTDESAGEIFALARDAFKGGQRAFQVHAFPFHMTAQKMAEYRNNPNFAFWQMLKDGYDHFEVTHLVPSVDVCDRRYVFNADAPGASFDPRGACPAYRVPDAVRIPVAAKQAADQKIFASLVTPEKSVASAPSAKTDLTTRARTAPDKAVATASTSKVTPPAPVVTPAPAATSATNSAEVKKEPSIFEMVFGPRT